MLFFGRNIRKVIMLLSALLSVKSSVSSPSDILLIRHGRSRVRHSNEKDYIRWGLKALDNLTLDYDVTDAYDNDTVLILSNDIWVLDNTTSTNQNSTSNSAYSYFVKTSKFDEKHNTFAEVNPSSATVAARKTFKKEKFMKNIRKSVNKGLEYLKIHNQLESAPHEPQNDAPPIINHVDKAKKKNEIATDLFTKVSVLESYSYEELPHSIPARLSVPYTQQLPNKPDIKTNSAKNISFLNSIAEEESEDTTYQSSNFDDLFSKKITDSSNNETESIEDYVLGNIFSTDVEDLSDLDEISRKNRMNLLKGRDVVTKFLQIVETQHLLGANCTAGTALNLGEGVVDQYAQDRFRIEAEVAVNRANMLTRIFKQSSSSVQASEHLLHASVLSMVEFDDDIFAAGNCFDWNQHPSKSGLFCPFAYRLPPPDQGAAFAKDLAAEYHYLGNTSEWFFLARKNAEKVIARNDQYTKSYHYYSNSTAREADVILTVKYDDGRWSKPYYDCGGGNIWMLTYTVPFFGYENGTYFFKGTSGIDIDLRRVDIDQCPQKNIPDASQPLNIFAGTDKCKQRTTMCEPIASLGFRRGSYKCVCRKGFFFPDTIAIQKYFNGSVLEEEYEKLMLGESSTYNKPITYECLPCAEGCDFCEDSSPCVAALNWPMRTSILILSCAIIGLLPPAAWFTFRYQQIKVVRAASPALLRVIALGAFFIYCTTIVMYPPPSLYTCTARIWLREIGFSLTYGALMLKTWRISVIFRVRSAKAVKITDAALLKRLGMICVFVGICLLIRTVMSPPEVVVGRTANDLKAFLCKTDWWDYTFTSMEVLFLTWGVRLCIMVRKAPSEFNESRFISMAIYNEFLLTCFLNVSMLFLQSPANPDLLYIIFFCHTQLTVTLLLGLIFGSKVYIVLRSGRSHDNTIGLGAKSSTAKFTFRPQVKAFANPSTATSSTAQLADIKLTDQEAIEEIRQLSIQLRRIQDLAPPRGVAVMTITSLLDSLKTTSQPLTLNASSSNSVTLPIFDYDPQKNAKFIATIDKAINTNISGDDFWHYLDFEYTGRHHTHRHHKCRKTMECEHNICSPLRGEAKKCDLSFSELYLECMCTEGVEVDSDTEPGKIDQSYWNVSMSSSTSQKEEITDMGGKDSKKDNSNDSKRLLICDKCKKNSVNTSPKCIELSLGRKQLSVDISECLQQSDPEAEDNTRRTDNNSVNNSSTSTEAKSNRKSDKKVINLNDKGKYTKEVSV